jgi:hypothetical protein
MPVITFQKHSFTSKLKSYSASSVNPQHQLAEFDFLQDKQTRKLIEMVDFNLL